MKRKLLLLYFIFSILSCVTAQQESGWKPVWFENLEGDGYVNRQGEKLQLPWDELQAAFEFYNGYAKVVVKKPSNQYLKMYIINENGEVILDLKELGINRMGLYRNEMFVAEKKSNEKWGYLDINGNWIKEPIYDDAGSFYSGRANLIIDNEIQLINESFKILDKGILLKREIGYGDFSEDRAIAHYNEIRFSPQGYVNENGKVEIPLIYKRATNFSEGVAAVQREDGKWICIDKDGNRVEQIPESEHLGSFHNGLAMIYRNGKGGYINHDGKIVIPCKYDYVTDFVDGYAAVSLDEPNRGRDEYIPRNRVKMNGEGMYAIVNTKGDFITDYIYLGIPRIELGGVAYVYFFNNKNEEFYGLVDLTSKGKIIESEKW